MAAVAADSKRVAPEVAADSNRVVPEAGADSNRVVPEVAEADPIARERPSHLYQPRWRSRRPTQGRFYEGKNGEIR